MKSNLRILHLEDNSIDGALIRATLESDGISAAITCLQSRVDFVAALERGGVDLILSDFSLPAFDGASALRIAHANWPEIPFIIVSGTLGEELAIDALKSGATDYVLKGSLSRLAPAVRRAMLEVEALAERERLQAQFIEAQKMEVIGRLAAGVAHDFNNILNVIMLYSDLMMQELPPGHSLRKPVEEIWHASERAAGLTQQLLIFGRKQTVQPVVLDLNDVTNDLHNMLRRLVDENIELTIVAGKQSGRVRVDPGYIGQVLMNLVVNARDAMPNGGRLTIECNDVTLEESDACASKGIAAGEYVMLSVSDTGTGMTDIVKARMFEAFFTTKPSGKGTGLGLATCHTIVQQSGGHIDVQSEVGKGTTFEIYLPRVDQPLEVRATPIERRPSPKGTETLLLVEDEPSLRHLASVVLEAQGYEVLSAANGQDGLEAARDHQGAPIRLVLSDVVMPLMGGREMADRLKEYRPDIKILFTSGYTDDAISHHGVLEPGVAFLAKPYKRAALIGKIRELLDEEME